MTYTDDEIKERLGKYGAVYLPSEIKDNIEDILGNESKKGRMEDFFKALKKYNKIAKQLKATKLNPNFTMLLYGPPGTGKTSLTRAFSKEYKIPICVVESDRLVSPLLGDTIKNIRNVVELAADIAKENGEFVLFFDEIDAIGSERSNIHEVGEIKRAVISFLQVIDRINYESVPLAIFGATNHEKQLDSAIWRRFTFHLKFDFPDYRLRKLILESFVNRIKEAKIGVDDSIFTKLNEEYEDFKQNQLDLEKVLGHEVSEFNDDIFWQKLRKIRKSKGLLELCYGYSGSDIKRGTEVALFKILDSELLTYDIFYSSLKLVGGTAIHLDSLDIITKPGKKSKTGKLGNINNNKKPPEI